MDHDRWLSVAAHSEQATFFHTPYWSEVAQASEPGLVGATLELGLADGETVIVPLVGPAAGGPGSVRSTFAGCYGGPIASRPLSAPEVAEITRELLRRFPSGVRLVLGPRTAHPDAPEGFTAVPDTTQTLDLRAGFDAILAGFSKGHRRAYHRTLREGVAVREADPRAGCDAYVEMYEEHLQAFGDEASSRYGRPTFDAMARIAAAVPESVRLWLAEQDGRPVAGCWAFYWNDHAVMWHGAARETGETMISPPTALYAEVARDAAARGLAVLDFNPSGGHEGPDAFKARFGTERQPVLRLHGAPSAPGRVTRAVARARRLAGRFT